LQERIEKKEFIFSYNPFDRIKKNKYHELSNFEKVMILKDLVMWQFKGSEKIQAMWQFKESEKARTLRQDTENDVRPVEIEVLGADSRGSTYFYLGAGARIYREIPSADDTQQCNWEALTTSLQDLKDLVSERVEIDPDRSEEERLLYKRISKELIPDVERQIEIKRAAEEVTRRKKRGKKKNKVQYNKSPRSALSVEETDDENNIQADVTASGVEPALSVSMWSATNPSTTLQPVQAAHDSKCFPTNQKANSDSNGVTTSTAIVNSAFQYDEDEDDVSTSTSSSIHEKSQPINRSSFAPKKTIFHKRRMKKEPSDDNDSNDSDYYLDSNKRVKFGLNNDDVMIRKSYDKDTTKRFNQVKGKGVLRSEMHDNSKLQNTDMVNSDAVSKNKGKSVLRDEGPSQIVESSYMNNYHNNADVTNLSEVVDREIFKPGPEELIKLEWSLNHVFFEELEIFGEDSDSELSECCDACIMEVDHLLAH